MNAPANPESLAGLFPAFFGILIASVLVWFVLITRLFHILRTRHPQTYDALRRPTLILNNNIQNGFAVIRFLLGGRFRDFDDPALLRLGGFMQVFFYTYLVLFVTFAGLIVFGGAILPP